MGSLDPLSPALVSPSLLACLQHILQCLSRPDMQGLSGFSSMCSVGQHLNLYFVYFAGFKICLTAVTGVSGCYAADSNAEQKLLIC